MSATPNAVIFYTTDGTTPTVTSQRYTGPFSVSGDTTITAIASFPNFSNSSPAVYVIDIVPAAAKTACDHQKRCFPNTYASEFRTDAECATAYSGLGFTPLQGTDPMCAPGAICGEITIECAKGTLANEKRCIVGAQCASGNCLGFTGTSCGACKPPKPKDAACSATDFTCAAGQRCDFGTGACVDAAKEGDSCAGAAVANCGSGLVCKSSTEKCAKPGQIGDTCDVLSGTQVSIECRGGLTCKNRKCEDIAPKFLEAGAACDPNNFQTERCKAGFACDATATKCQEPDFIDCKN